MRYVFKNILKYYPLCGFGFAAHGGVFVKRDGTYNDEKMRQVMQMLIKRYAENRDAALQYIRHTATQCIGQYVQFLSRFIDLIWVP